MSENLLNFYKDGLLTDTIPWWQNRFIDREDGGFLTCFDADGSLLGTDKPVWLLARIIWMWSRLYNTVEQRRDWLEAAGHGMDFMLEHAFDTDGRMFYSLTKQGSPLRKRRYLYTECFGVMALAEYARAEGSEELLKKSQELYRLVLRYHDDPRLLSAKVMPRTRMCRSLAMPMILIAVSQVMREAQDDVLYGNTIERFKKEILRDFVKPEKKCMLEMVLDDGTILDTPEGRTVNPGHCVETAWFLMEEVRRKHDPGLLAAACEILEWSLSAGWDGEYGGILYFIDCDGKPPLAYEHELKLWWPHTEAIYACLLAYYLTGDMKWALWHGKLHDWAFNHFPDQENGEWFGYLRRDGTLSSRVKGNMWKGPFHLPRFQLYGWKLLEKMKQENKLPGQALSRLRQDSSGKTFSSDP